ncbi:MAG: hypothetical protein JWN04_195, partial [Myxococcaceae bacterium]|nr:hypothetical protein [Myxococcaceae bacterium]
MTRMSGRRSIGAWLCTFALALAATSLLLPARGLAQARGDLEASSKRRIAITSTVTLSAAALAIGGGVGAGFGTARRCHAALPTDVIGCGVGGGVVLLGVSLGALPIALTLGSYLPHHGLDGRGKWYAALAGAAVGMGAGLGILSLALDGSDSNAAVLTGSIVGGLVAASVPVLALELSHARQMKKEREAPRASARRT